MTTIAPKKTIQNLGKYQCPDEGRLDYIRLDFNENTNPVLDKRFSNYPEYKGLNNVLAQIFSADASNLTITNGTDEALFLIANTFIEPDKEYALVSTPTFSMIRRSLVIAGANLIEVPVLSDLSYDIDGLESALKSKEVKLAIFASPDNPTGSTIELDTIDKWCKEFPKTLFVLDEAYAEYAGINAIPMVKRYKNLLVTRTFSKAWGMAGLRLGVIFGDEELISSVNVLKMPYNVNTVASDTSASLIEIKEKVLKSAKETIERKEEVINALEKLGFQMVKGKGNFFLLDVDARADEFYSFLRNKGILVRNLFKGDKKDRQNPLWGKVRISIGTEEENNQLVNAIGEWRKYSSMENKDEVLAQ